MTLQTQLMTMITMVISGIYLGFATETFRRIFNRFRNNIFLTYLLEITFWVVQTCLLFIVLYHVNDAEIRFYIFLACLLGFSIYIVLFQTLYKQVLEVIIQVMRSISKWTIQIINVLVIQPIIWMIHLSLKILFYIVSLCYRLLLFILKTLFYPVQIILPKKIYNKINNMLVFCSTIINNFIIRIKSLFIRK